MPLTLLVLWRRQREASRLLEEFPRIPGLEEAAVDDQGSP
jgi:hypothetical protein